MHTWLVSQARTLRQALKHVLCDPIFLLSIYIFYYLFVWLSPQPGGDSQCLYTNTDTQKNVGEMSRVVTETFSVKPWDRNPQFSVNGSKRRDERTRLHTPQLPADAFMTSSLLGRQPFFVTLSPLDICRGTDKTEAIRQIIGSLSNQVALGLTNTSQAGEEMGSAKCSASSHSVGDTCGTE